MIKIRRQLTSLVAVIALAAIATVVGVYILQNQRLRFPVFEAKPFTLKAEFSTSQAVVPGQGQTIRVAGVRIGDIGKTELKEGRAVVTMDLDREFADLVHTDASALLRPKTGLKDMFVELNPGTKGAPLAKENFTLPIASTLPDVNPDEILAGLDQDTRDYFVLLLNGAGGGLRGRGDDLRDVLRRFEPTIRDSAIVNGELVKRGKALKRLIRSLNVVNASLASRDDDLSRLIAVSDPVLDVFARERAGVEGTIRELPGALRSARTSLRRVESLANVLRPAADNLRPVARALDDANDQLIPFAREAAPILRTKIRPLTRDLRPLLRDLKPAADDLVRSEGPLIRSFKVLNVLFNLLANNPRGAEAPDAANRDEGYLFLLAWAGHQATSLWSNVDAHGPLRAVTLGGTCQTLNALGQSAPQLVTLLNLTGPLTDPAICG